MKVDSKAKPAFPRQTSVWWFDCKSAQNNPSRRGGLFAGHRRPIFVGSSANDMDGDLMGSSSSLRAQVVEVNKDDKDWVKHGQFDEEEYPPSYSHSSDSCKTNPLLILGALVTLTISCVSGQTEWL